ncbi:KAT8 regulatory NSL complex subunit 1-like isoform X2 [Pseudophryne corroboree]|uniref:KAT8 regulatory NSL complex subunit 1-like isoform X2 n=1 Tax=Pseudophryne corroboree TaxID=495146 RepID=UPI00308131E9
MAVRDCVPSRSYAGRKIRGGDPWRSPRPPLTGVVRPRARSDWHGTRWRRAGWTRNGRPCRGGGGGRSKGALFPSLLGCWGREGRTARVPETVVGLGIGTPRPGHEEPGAPGAVTRAPPPARAGDPRMADMAPALTGAAPHRLKLSAPAWQPLLLNGGKGRVMPGGRQQEPGVRPQEEPEAGVRPQEPGVRPQMEPEPGVRPQEVQQRAARMSGRQQELGARARTLCRRLQVIQAKQVERHVRQQLSGLVELLARCGEDGLPGTPHMELDRLASSSTARLRAAQGGFDSDATESSSGGESDGEEATGSEEEESPGSDQHAEWRWAVERAAIICRWTWLQAQVSDLEFRIRQQTEIYKQIRCTKGSVVLGDSSHCEDATTRPFPGPSAVLSARGSRLPSAVKAPLGDNLREATSSTPTPSLQNSDKQCSRLTQSVENVACQNPLTTPMCASPGSQKTSRQVNGFLNCVRSSLPCNGSSEDSEDVLGKKPRVEALSTLPAVIDPTCMAARIRPLRGHKKRRLVRSSDVSALSRKPQKQLSTKCGCEPPTACILCGCKSYAKTVHPSTMTLSERIALMDSSYHPILSFPYDTPLDLHFEALLKEDRQFRLSHRLKAIKLSQLSRKSLERVRRDCSSPSSDLTGSCAYGRNDPERLDLYRAEAWQRNIRLIPDSQLRRTPSGFLFREDRQYKGVLNPSIHVPTPVTPRPSPSVHQLSSFMENIPGSSASQQNSASMALKRKRFENSYDIDNIVIPMSMAAVARVEKIQYKEILTPSWRVLDSVERDTTLKENPQLEDLSDEAYLDRHSTYEEMERSRWDYWTSAVPQRRGSRSSNKSDGRWTPQPSSNSQGSLQPASPDTGCHSLNDVPLSLSSAAVDNTEPYSTVQCLSVHSRQRVLSWSEDTRSSTPEFPDEEERVVLPWDSRSFPLADRDHRALQDLPVTPSKGRNKPHQDILWHTSNKLDARTESIDFGMSTENLAPTSKEPPLPNSISVVRFHAPSGEKIASLEYFPARPVNKR